MQLHDFPGKADPTELLDDHDLEMNLSVEATWDHNLEDGRIVTPPPHKTVAY